MGVSKKLAVLRLIRAGLIAHVLQLMNLFNDRLYILRNAAQFFLRICERLRAALRLHQLLPQRAFLLLQQRALGIRVLLRVKQTRFQLLALRLIACDVPLVLGNQIPDALLVFLQGINPLGKPVVPG